ncbi:MAG: disulfide bond formation protein DsbA [Betaproteobacteria bacterium HGW-Betaproteobacteria-8]|nr:MAG: disulfide bond formation protein DsbA [Betaproteobacteria bacterium HGW-Betaproteobacteria-8]
MKKLFAALMLLASTSLMADPMAGVEYNTTAQNIPTENAAKVEVTELFWYGCGHCNSLEPQLHAWANKLPADVVFKRVPGLPRPDWAPMAKAYYAMEALGLLDKLHNKLFAAIHKQRTLNPTDEAAAINWISKEGGLDKKKVQEAFNSFSTNTKLNRAAQIFRASGATGVPSLIIDGKYITSSSMAGGNIQVLKVADYLIAKARTEK